MSEHQYNVEPTAQVIEDMAEELETRAKELRRTALALRESKDFDYAGQALAIVGRIHSNIRFDLLLTRPLRAIEQQNRRQPESQPGK